MTKWLLTLLAAALAAGPVLAADPPAKTDDPLKVEAPKDPNYWVEPMKKVHAKFTGEKGTFAHFGDSITITMAFWSSLKYDHKNMDEATTAAFERVNKHMKADCWTKWKGPEYGNTGMMTIDWAYKNVDKWLKAHNPEVAMIMFGTNDLGALTAEQYEMKYRDVVKKCLDNGTVVIMQTIPPRHGHDAKAKVFASIQKKVAYELNVPVSDYYNAIMTRRPDDWDGALPKFKGEGSEYEVPTLVARDGIHPSNPKTWAGDYSAEGLKNNGFVLRNYMTLLCYDQVVTGVLEPSLKPAAAPAGAAPAPAGG